MDAEEPPGPPTDGPSLPARRSDPSRRRQRFRLQIEKVIQSQGDEGRKLMQTISREIRVLLYGTEPGTMNAAVELNHAASILLQAGLEPERVSELVSRFMSRWRLAQSQMVDASEIAAAEGSFDLPAVLHVVDLTLQPSLPHSAPTDQPFSPELYFHDFAAQQQREIDYRVEVALQRRADQENAVLEEAVARLEIQLAVQREHRARRRSLATIAVAIIVIAVLIVELLISDVRPAGFIAGAAAGTLSALISITAGIIRLSTPIFRLTSPILRKSEHRQTNGS